ncbi:proline racemase family protein [Amycolatopsis sp. NPDC088138]|uniref:proline racemase family protein n=1 Tax=Amycolatopsis sp. NPDC088138 TaxID=3363938 RepID=UPI0038093CC3
MITTTDYHTAGEPFRIVTAGVPEIPGATVLERRAAAQTSPEIDAVRQLLVREPRGHADMYGCFLVPPDDDGAEFGVLFWHKDGYSTACGHGTIALGAWAVRTGRVAAASNGVTDVVMDVPSGRVTAAVSCVDGVARRVSFRNVDSYVMGRDVEVVTKRGTVRVDVSYGGAIYASVPASALGLAVVPEQYSELIAAGREIKWALNATEWATHTGDSRLSGVYATMIYDDLGDTPEGPHQRNITVFADGQADRSPCGSGTSARLALLAADGRLPAGAVLTHDSIIGTTFTGRVVSATSDAVATEIEGTAYQTGECTFALDPADDLGTGFLLR